MARRTPPEENIPLIVFKPFVWRNSPPRKPAGPQAQGAPAVPTTEKQLPSPFDPKAPLSTYTRFDGHLVGNGQEYPPGTLLSQIHGVMPSSGHPTQKIIFVNGINNSPTDHYNSLKAIADHANAEVVGVYNATEGGFKDTLQCIGDKLGWVGDWLFGHNPAVDSLRDTLSAELRSDSHEPINLMAHSQGALVTSRALGEVRNRLHEAGFSPKEVDARMSRINVETFGGAAWIYPDGPHYDHHTNVLDPISNAFGQGTLPLAAAAAEVIAHPTAAPAVIAGLTANAHNPGGGAGSQQHSFVGYSSEPSSVVSKAHEFDRVYLPQWESPFPRNVAQ